MKLTKCRKLLQYEKNLIHIFYSFYLPKIIDAYIRSQVCSLAQGDEDDAAILCCVGE